MGTLLERPARIGLHPCCPIFSEGLRLFSACRHWPDESVSAVILDVNRICGRPSAIFRSLIFWSVHSARTIDHTLFLRRQLAMFRDRSVRAHRSPRPGQMADGLLGAACLTGAAPDPAPRNVADPPSSKQVAANLGVLQHAALAVPEPRAELAGVESGLQY